LEYEVIVFANLDWATLQPFLPYVVGGVVVLVALVGLRLLTGRQRGLQQPPRLKQNTDSTGDDDTFANRRSAPRRDGTAVKVVISSPTFRGQLETGWVLDRSTGGLRIAVQDAIAVGATLQVRTENAPDTIPWVTVVVRSCRKDEKHHELGCSFETTPPWNVLLLFG
jgi:hypothetical protein